MANYYDEVTIERVDTPEAQPVDAGVVLEASNILFNLEQSAGPGKALNEGERKTIKDVRERLDAFVKTLKPTPSAPLSGAVGFTVDEMYLFHVINDWRKNVSSPKVRDALRSDETMASLAVFIKQAKGVVVSDQAPAAQMVADHYVLKNLLDKSEYVKEGREGSLAGEILSSGVVKRMPTREELVCAIARTIGNDGNVADAILALFRAPDEVKS